MLNEYMIAEIDTDAHYVYFVIRILSYVPFCICNEFSFNNMHKQCLLFLQLKHETKTSCITTKSLCQN